jgi:hypothetical protein
MLYLRTQIVRVTLIKEYGAKSYALQVSQRVLLWQSATVTLSYTPLVAVMGECLTYYNMMPHR